MRLSSQNSQFYFLLPTWFYNPVQTTYDLLLKKDKVQYDNVSDYINSTIKEIDFPGLDLETQSQFLLNKEINFSSSKSDYDLSSRSTTVVFKDVDAKINYFIMRNLVLDYYGQTSKSGKDKFGDFSLTTLDINGDAIFRIKFRQCQITNFSQTKFAYSDQSTEEKTFSLSFKYNFADVSLMVTEDSTDDTPDELLLRELILDDGPPINIPFTTEEKPPIVALRTHHI